MRRRLVPRDQQVRGQFPGDPVFFNDVTFETSFNRPVSRAPKREIADALALASLAPEWPAEANR